jgi:hypothetical protein
MKTFLPTLAALTVLLAGCSKCKCDEPNPNEYISGSGLPGNWKLVKLQCYCTPGPTPDERLTITATDFAEYRDGAQILDATYTIGSTSLCGLPSASPALNLVPRITLDASRHPGYTLNSDTLVLDYGSPCDAPRKTYRRVR